MTSEPAPISLTGSSVRKRVYKFTSAPYGISNLQNKRLKVSTLKDLNDPFDLFAAIDTTDPRIEHTVTALIPYFSERFGLLCFTRNWDNLLLWSHYGASHTGVCLGFDVPQFNPGSNHDTDVLYQPNLLQIRNLEDVSFDLANRLLRTKHESWSYEQEVRMFVNLEDPPDATGLNWIEFGPLLKLKEVIVGAQCDPTVSAQVEGAVKPYGDEVKFWWAGMRKDAFLLVKQAHRPYWHARVRSTSETGARSVEQ